MQVALWDYISGGKKALYAYVWKSKKIGPNSDKKLQEKYKKYRNWVKTELNRSMNFPRILWFHFLRRRHNKMRVTKHCNYICYKTCLFKLDPDFSKELKTYVLPWRHTTNWHPKASWSRFRSWKFTALGVFWFWFRSWKFTRSELKVYALGVESLRAAGRYLWVSKWKSKKLWMLPPWCPSVSELKVYGITECLYLGVS